MSNKTISIIIPVRNQARTLPRLLARLRELKTPDGWDKEIIAGYTESSDDTLAVLEREKVEVVHSTEIGPGAGRNAAARQSKGELLYFIDADACPAGDDFLIKLIDTAAKLGNFGAFGGPIVLDRSQAWNPIAQGDHFACWFLWHAKRASEETDIFQPSVSLVMRRSVFESVGGFDVRLRVLEDYELQERLMQRELPIYFVQSLAVTHSARSSLLRSWRHSWYWGGPFRKLFFGDRCERPLRFPVGSRWFWLNVPRLFWKRMVWVVYNAGCVSRWWACLAFPFVTATVLAWCMGVGFGKEAPSRETPAPV